MIRDYSNKTADEWFASGKWTGFLMNIPAGKSITKECRSSRDIPAIRTTAAMLSNNPECGLRFSVGTDVNNERLVTVEAKRK